jgi:hypothetical protein
MAVAVLVTTAIVGAVAQTTPTPGAASQSTAQEIERLRLAYFAEVSACRGQYEQADTQLLTQYGDAVARFARESQARGDFESWQAGNAERDRFAKSKGVVTSDLVASPAPLRTLQERAIQARIELRRTYAKTTVELTDRLVARLEAMKRELTIRGDAASAQLTVDAGTRARASDVYTAALFALDDPAAALAAPSPGTVDDGATIGTSSGTVSGGPIRIPNSAGVRVHEPGYEPMASGGAQRICQLAETAGSTSAPSKVAATARYALRPQIVLQFADERVTTDAVALQIGLRTLPGAGPLGPMTLVVEYFGHRYGGVPEALTYTAANLASLDHRLITIDMPVTSHQLRISNTPVGGIRRHLDSGLQFAGVVISVFEPSGAILYQGVSDRSLLPFAGTAARYRSDGTLNRAEAPATP